MLKRHKIFLLLLIATIIICYLNSFENRFVWDDLNNIVNNRELNQVLGWRDLFLRSSSMFYRPISYLTIIFDYRIWGKNYFGYHLTNLIFHIFNALLIFCLADRLTSSKNISYFSSLLFAVHPIHTEAVTYISGRSDPVCAFFIFSSFYLYLLFLDATKNKTKFVLYSGSLILFLLALLAKEVALIFPFLLFCYNLCFLRSSLWQKTKTIIPFVALTLIFLLFMHFFVGENTGSITFGSIKNIFKILLFYLCIVIFPFNLHMQHNLNEYTFLDHMPIFLSAIIFFGIIFIILKIFKERYIHFALLWFIIFLIPFSGILKLHADVAEHWLYVPSFGLFLIVAGLLSKNDMKLSKIISALIILFLSVLTINQNTHWRDDITLYKYTLKYRPSDYKLHYNLGNAYLRKKEFNAAYREYITALRLNPNYAYALNNLGIVAEKRGNLEEACQLYKKAAFFDPELAQAKRNALRLQFIPSTFAQDYTHFDHSLFGEVLAKYTENGKVDYKALKNDPSLLNAYLEKVAGLTPQAIDFMSDSEKIVFYINIYNAFTLKAIVNHYPIRSIRDIPGVWDRLKFKVAQRNLTLGEIEHEILRKEFSEPRVHFALVCASESCPELRGVPFSAENIDKELFDETFRFINDKTKNRLDKQKNILYLSSIFKWFQKDFGDVIEFISGYLTDDEVIFIRENSPKIKYNRYDWSLNGKNF